MKVDIPEAPLELEDFLLKARHMWEAASHNLLAGELPATLYKAWLTGLFCYALVQQGRTFLTRAHLLMREESWQEIEALAMETWATLKEETMAFLGEHMNAVEWFEVIESLDEQVITWLTDETRTDKARQLMAALEGRADQIIGQGIDLAFAQTKQDVPWSKLDEYREDLEKWIAFMIDRILA